MTATEFIILVIVVAAIFEIDRNARITRKKVEQIEQLLKNQKDAKEKE